MTALPGDGIFEGRKSRRSGKDKPVSITSRRWHIQTSGLMTGPLISGTRSHFSWGKELPPNACEHQQMRPVTAGCGSPFNSRLTGRTMRLLAAGESRGERLSSSSR